MRLNRFIGNFNLDKRNIRVSDPEIINQIRKVLRLDREDEVILCDGNMNEAKARLTEISKDFVEFEVFEKNQNQNESERKVVLHCSILKRENFELVVQKATEIGVKEIVPLITSRTVKLDIRKDRLEKIIREAAEQSGRGIVPVLREPLEFNKAIEISKDDNLNVFFDLSGVSFETIDRLEMDGHKEYIGAWVGPEGGWTSQEIDFAQKSNFKIINLNKLTLRAETAAIIGSYLIINSS